MNINEGASSNDVELDPEPVVDDPWDTDAVAAHDAWEARQTARAQTMGETAGETAGEEAPATHSAAAEFVPPIPEKAEHFFSAEQNAVLQRNQADRNIGRLIERKDDFSRNEFLGQVGYQLACAGKARDIEGLLGAEVADKEAIIAEMNKLVAKEIAQGLRVPDGSEEASDWLDNYAEITGVPVSEFQSAALEGLAHMRSQDLIEKEAKSGLPTPSQSDLSYVIKRFGITPDQYDLAGIVAKAKFDNWKSENTEV